jgi:hypothetical protein
MPVEIQKGQAKACPTLIAIDAPACLAILGTLVYRLSTVLISSHPAAESVRPIVE